MSDLKDPRVLFAAECTLLAWNRSSVSLITLGFVVERFGLFVHQLGYSTVASQRGLSFSIGLTLIIFASFLCLISIFQFKSVLKSLTAAEIPPGYWLWSGALANLMVVLLGIVLAIYLVRGFG